MNRKDELPKSIWNIKVKVFGNTEIILRKDSYKGNQIVLAKSDKPAIIFRQADKYK